MECVWWFLFGLCLIYALAITNKIVSQYKFFISDGLIKKKKKSTHSQIKYNNQNTKSKHTQKSSNFENIIFFFKFTLDNQELKWVSIVLLLYSKLLLT